MFSYFNFKSKFNDKFIYNFKGMKINVKNTFIPMCDQTGKKCESNWEWIGSENDKKLRWIYSYIKKIRRMHLC